MISPEEMARTCLDDTLVKEKEDKILFFKNAAVVVFDGLIIWRGDLNMNVAQDRLKLLAKAIGLPVAVIAEKELETLKKKKSKTGKYLGPNFWNNYRSWDNITGLDPIFWKDYDKECIKVKTSKTIKSNVQDNWTDNDEDNNLTCFGYRNQYY